MTSRAHPTNGRPNSHFERRAEWDPSSEPVTPIALEPDVAYLADGLDHRRRYAVEARHRLALIVTVDRLEPVRRWFQSRARSPGRDDPAGGLAARHPERASWLDLATLARRDPSDRVRALLGSERQGIWLDARHFDAPNLLAAACGALVAGGVLVFVVDTSSCPEAPRAARSGRFRQRLQHRLAHRIIPVVDGVSGVWTLRGTSRPATSARATTTGGDPRHDVTATWHREQDALLATLDARLDAPGQIATVVVAERGRGKSAVLGRCAESRLARGEAVACTASQRAALDVFARHAGRWSAPRAPRDAMSPLGFLPIDEATRRGGDLLFVDEASQLPLATLVRLASQWRRVVFAATTVGYEGAGRGFALRLAARFAAHGLRFERANLVEPVRWAADDPLEHAMNDLLLLDAADPPPPDFVRHVPAAAHRHPSGFDVEHIESIAAERLTRDEPLLRAVFALLARAHYRTTPDDLLGLLDSDTLALRIARAGRHVAGVLLSAREAPLAPAIHASVLARRRRPPHALLGPLLAQVVMEAAPLSWSNQRIVRIAVDPAFRRRRIGTSLVLALCHPPCASATLIGSSFGFDAELFPFWSSLELRPVHLGWRRSPRSGLRAICMVRTNDAQAERLCTLAGQRLADNLDAWQAAHETLSAADRQDTLALLAALQSPSSAADTPARPSLDDTRQLDAFVSGARSLVDTAAALRRHLVDSGESAGGRGWLDRWLHDRGLQFDSRRMQERVLRERLAVR